MHGLRRKEIQSLMVLEVFRAAKGSSSRSLFCQDENYARGITIICILRLYLRIFIFIYMHIRIVVLNLIGGSELCKLQLKIQIEKYLI